MDPGFTLLETTVAVALTALVLSFGLPAARRAVDRSAVVGAREALVGMVLRGRSEARARGGARIVLDGPAARIRVEAASGQLLDSLDLGAAFGVALHPGGSAPVAALAFDGLGIGRLASRTVEIRRGGAVAGIVVSSYGRVTRR